MVFTKGFTDLDHLHPGWNVARPTVLPPTFMISTFPLSNVLTSSGRLRLFPSIFAILITSSALLTHVSSVHTCVQNIIYPPRFPDKIVMTLILCTGCFSKDQQFIWVSSHRNSNVRHLLPVLPPEMGVRIFAGKIRLKGAFRQKGHYGGFPEPWPSIFLLKGIVIGVFHSSPGWPDRVSLHPAHFEQRVGFRFDHDGIRLCSFLQPRP